MLQSVSRGDPRQSHIGITDRRRRVASADREDSTDGEDAPARILVVDDEAFVGEAVGLLLNEKGYAAHHVFSGEDALRHLQADQAFDMVLMDIMLGDDRMNGGAAAAEIRARFDLPVVFYTGFSGEETLGKTEPEDSFGYVQKSSGDRGFLLRSIKAALARSRQEKRLGRELTLQRTQTQEAHHRVKNNLMVLAGRIALEEPVAPEACRDLLHRIEGQVHAVEKLHALLQEEQDSSHVELLSYLGDVLTAVFPPDPNYRVEARSAQDAGDPGRPTVVSGKIAVPVAMIITELALNSLKHEFVPERRNEFTVRVHRGNGADRMIVDIRTNGRASIPEAASMEQKHGTQIVHTLIRQLEAQLRVRHDPAPRFILEIPLGPGTSRPRAE